MNIRAAALLGALSISSLILCGAAAQPQGHELPHGHPPVGGTPAKQPSTPGAGDQPAARPADVESIDAIVKSFYESTSGRRGEPRQWDRFRSLFAKNARMIPVHHAPHGDQALFFIPVEDYIEHNRKYLEKAGFAEREVSRRTEQFGSIAHIFSTYESRRNPEDAEAYSRGIYSIQLSTDGSRWYIVNVMWDSERPNQPLPEKYLKPSP
jgi:hypothetical protein